MRHFERQCALFTLLLEVPVPPEWKGAGYSYRLGRDPLRNADELKRELGVAYVERRRHEYGRDISQVVSVRTQRKLRRVV